MIDNYNLLLNSPLEIGLRSLIILSINTHKSFDIELLSYYDYYSTHLYDLDNSYESLHPLTPYRFGELITKQQILKAGLALMIKKNLITIELDYDGIKYKTTHNTITFLKYFNSNYFIKLKNNIEICSKLLNNIDKDELKNKFEVLYNNISTNNTFESVIRGV
ncbi:ABC-three component system middle component 2 [Clostridium intestinale]|uniref:Uncharacterized protein n=1 Tax=Clostridium intestinale DSM 6191 TaxID=1121320 RepID=A0A1M5TDB8_9CLOT|nr:ABC-three component system middle component 2 [Clostridium intestinale]SHH48709.1 hypothetical protein SAMN02745941_00176 [Clostridium intestinale DSM 6191]